MQKSNWDNRLKKWVEAEAAKRLDKDGFWSLPLKMRTGLFILAASYMLSYLGTPILIFLAQQRGELATGLWQGTVLYAFTWVLGAVGLALAGKDSIKYPCYFSAKLLKVLFPKHFNTAKFSETADGSFFESLNAWLLIVLLLAFAISKLTNHFVVVWVVLLATLLINQSVYIYGMFATGSDVFFESLRGEDLVGSEVPQVMFRFDDGPDPQYTLRILEILREHNLRAIFAVVGSKVELYPEILRQIQAEGHLIANHTFSHSAGVLFMSYQRFRAEIERTNALIAEVIGETPHYFASPMGFRNPTIGSVIRDLNLISLMWDVKTCDSQLQLPQIMNRIKRLTKPKNIILLHDSTALCGKPDREATVEALRESIAYFKAKGWL